MFLIKLLFFSAVGLIKVLFYLCCAVLIIEYSPKTGERIKTIFEEYKEPALERIEEFATANLKDTFISSSINYSKKSKDSLKEDN